jgi:hypothetical protein
MGIEKGQLGTTNNKMGVSIQMPSCLFLLIGCSVVIYCIQIILLPKMDSE